MIHLDTYTEVSNKQLAKSGHFPTVVECGTTDRTCVLFYYYRSSSGWHTRNSSIKINHSAGTRDGLHYNESVVGKVYLCVLHFVLWWLWQENFPQLWGTLLLVPWCCLFSASFFPGVIWMCPRSATVVYFLTPNLVRSGAKMIHIRQKPRLHLQAGLD